MNKQLAKEAIGLIIGVPKETYPGERRVALVPMVVPTLTKAGFEVVIEAGAGVEAGYLDSFYTEKGAKILPQREAVFSTADIVVQVLCYGSNDVTGQRDLPYLRPRQMLIGFLRPLGSREVMQQVAETGVTAFSVEMVPRTTRAQSMDALSSMGTICGYKAVLIAADTLPRIFPMLTTAAGTITPSRVFVIGAGVAGLQAIATARRQVRSPRPMIFGQRRKNRCRAWAAGSLNFPLRPKMPRTNVGMDAPRMRLFTRASANCWARVVAESDVVITAAVIPGKKSPVLVTGEMVHRMAPGSVIFDLAAERGGNCELTRRERRSSSMA